jgi:hypothetical protein
MSNVAEKPISKFKKLYGHKRASSGIEPLPPWGCVTVTEESTLNSIELMYMQRG